MINAAPGIRAALVSAINDQNSGRMVGAGAVVSVDVNQDCTMAIVSYEPPWDDRQILGTVTESVPLAPVLAHVLNALIQGEAYADDPR